MAPKNNFKANRTESLACLRKAAPSQTSKEVVNNDCRCITEYIIIEDKIISGLGTSLIIPISGSLTKSHSLNFIEFQVIR